MARVSNKLTAVAVQKAHKPGRYADGGGLYLQVRAVGAKSWLLRYMRNGKAVEMGLGAVADVSLAEARNLAGDARKLLTAGKDPLAEKRAQEAAAQVDQAKVMTFKNCADAYVGTREAGWRNPKHRQQWRNTLETYVYPVFGHLPVGDVDLGLVLKVLEPLWTAKPETAGRVRGRIEAILDWAAVRGYRSGENPARWKGHLDKVLPTRSRVKRVTHHAALPYDDMAGFMAALRGREGISARALEFTILTAARTSEALLAEWVEFDLENQVWNVPGERMKSGREHRVPLVPRCVDILKEMAQISTKYVFPGHRKGRPFSNMAFLQLLSRMKYDNVTAHGFRSTFRDWAAECTNVPNIVAEAALAHVVADKTEAAYRRGDLFAKRRKLMEAWANYCAMPAKSGKVIQFAS